MSTGGFITHARFKKYQLDHLIDVILDAGGDPDHAARWVADLYPTNNVQDYINITEMDLNAMTLTKSNNTDALTLPNALKRRILSTKGFWQNWGDNSTRDWTILSMDDFEEYMVKSLWTQCIPANYDCANYSNRCHPYHQCHICCYPCETPSKPC